MYNVKDFNNNDFFSDGKRFLLNKFNSEIKKRIILKGIILLLIKIRNQMMIIMK